MLLDDIAAALIAASIGATDGVSDWMIFKGFMEDTPDRAIGLYETGGPAPEEGMQIDYPTFQVRVRGGANDYALARTTIQAIFAALQDADIALGAVYVFCYAVQSGPLAMGRDEKRRPHLAQNWRTMKARS